MPYHATTTHNKKAFSSQPYKQVQAYATYQFQPAVKLAYTAHCHAAVAAAHKYAMAMLHAMPCMPACLLALLLLLMLRVCLRQLPT